MIYVGFAKDVEARFDTANYELERPLPKVKNQKCYSINEGWIRWENNNRVYGIEAKIYSYLTDDHVENKKSKNTKK